MYERFYGFSTLPFSLLPDENFLFLSKRHRRAISMLEYGIASHAGFIVITGDIGAGKTTIIHRFLKQANHDLHVGVINNPSRNLGNLMNWVAMAFELPDAGGDEPKAYDYFLKFLVAQFAENKRVVLVIDEAQNLSVDMLEELRMLSNVNNGNEQLLQIVLVGQPELLETLKRHDLRQFLQRISVHCYLDPLSPSETLAYIRHRILVAHGNPNLFDDEAGALVYYFTSGVPRLINLLCDQALVYGYSEEKSAISSALVMEAAADRESTKLSPFKSIPLQEETQVFEQHIHHIIKQMREEPIEGV